jgi:hypothetical protein
LREGRERYLNLKTRESERGCFDGRHDQTMAVAFGRRETIQGPAEEYEYGGSELMMGEAGGVFVGQEQ